MNQQRWVIAMILPLFLFSFVVTAPAAEPNSIDGISDNSFLIEEAYNQEPGKENLQMVLGVGAPIGVSRQADKQGVFLYFSIEHNFL